MLDPTHPIAELLRRDQRYRFDAYLFVFESLRYAQEVLGMGTERPTDAADAAAPDQSVPQGGSEHPPRGERHLTGQELCEAIRRYALQQYGYMAKSVLNHWGVYETSDFGEIVFNLIEIGQMRKTDTDRREDFEDVYTFDEAFQEKFEFTAPE